MINEYNKGYCDGYSDGYRQGAEDAANGVSLKYADDDVLNLPIHALDLSTRAHNCIQRAGCTYIRDVAVLSEERIAVMRNLGPVSANEIALALIRCNVHHTHWERYLL